VNFDETTTPLENAQLKFLVVRSLDRATLGQAVRAIRVSMNSRRETRRERTHLWIMSTARSNRLRTEKTEQMSFR
jgi:hypothetical protein